MIATNADHIIWHNAIYRDNWHESLLAVSLNCTETRRTITLFTQDTTLVLINSPENVLTSPEFIPDKGRCTKLIKSNRPLVQLHRFVTYVLGKYFIFDKTSDIMLYFQYILKLITCHASFRSSDTKQWNTLWIWKSCLNCVTDNISRTYHNL